MPQQIRFVGKRLKWIHWRCLCFTTLSNILQTHTWNGWMGRKSPTHFSLYFTAFAIRFYHVFSFVVWNVLFTSAERLLHSSMMCCCCVRLHQQWAMCVCFHCRWAKKCGTVYCCYLLSCVCVCVYKLWILAKWTHCFGHKLRDKFVTAVLTRANCEMLFYFLVYYCLLLCP